MLHVRGSPCTGRLGVCRPASPRGGVGVPCGAWRPATRSHLVAVRGSGRNNYAGSLFTPACAASEQMSDLLPDARRVAQCGATTCVGTVARHHRSGGGGSARRILFSPAWPPSGAWATPCLTQILRGVARRWAVGVRAGGLESALQHTGCHRSRASPGRRGAASRSARGLGGCVAADSSGPAEVSSPPGAGVVAVPRRPCWLAGHEALCRRRLGIAAGRGWRPWGCLAPSGKLVHVSRKKYLLIKAKALMINVFPRRCYTRRPLIMYTEPSVRVIGEVGYDALNHQVFTKHEDEQRLGELSSQGKIIVCTTAVRESPRKTS